METSNEATNKTIALAYNKLAADYTKFVQNSLKTLPLDRAILQAFTDLTLGTGTNLVGDMGCGPGHITAHLNNLGLETFGVDISTTLIEHATQNYPKLQFFVESMTNLKQPDNTFGGIVCWYSLIHLPPENMYDCLLKFYNKIKPGGYLLLAFFEAEQQNVSPFDHAVTTAYKWPINQLVKIAKTVNFQETARLTRQPLPEERFPRGHLILQKN